MSSVNQVTVSTSITRFLQFSSKDIFDSTLIDVVTGAVCARVSHRFEPSKDPKTAGMVKVELRIPHRENEDATLSQSPHPLAHIREKVFGSISWPVNAVHDAPDVRINHVKPRSFQELFDYSGIDDIDAHIKQHKYICFPSRIGQVKTLDSFAKPFTWRLDKHSVGLYCAQEADFAPKQTPRPEPIAELLCDSKVAGKENETIRLKHTKLHDGHTYFFYQPTHNDERDVEMILCALLLEIFRRGLFGLSPYTFKELTHQEQNDKERKWSEKKDKARAKQGKEDGKALPLRTVVKTLYKV